MKGRVPVQPHTIARDGRNRWKQSKFSAPLQDTEDVHHRTRLMSSRNTGDFSVDGLCLEHLQLTSLSLPLPLSLLLQPSLPSRAALLSLVDLPYTVSSPYISKPTSTEEYMEIYFTLNSYLVLILTSVYANARRDASLQHHALSKWSHAFSDTERQRHIEIA